MLTLPRRLFPGSFVIVFGFLGVRFTLQKSSNFVVRATSVWRDVYSRCVLSGQATETGVDRAKAKMAGELNIYTFPI